MTFLEPWSKDLKIDKHTFRPHSSYSGFDADGIEDFEEGEEENHDPNTEPDTSSYEPISFEEIIEDPVDHFEDIDWDSINQRILEKCREFASIWEELTQHDLDEPPVISHALNLHGLDSVRQSLINTLSYYKDIIEFGAWIVQANEELDALRREYEKISLSFLKKTKASLEIKIQDLENEIEEFEEDWKIPERIYECEELLLQTYVKEVVKAQKRIVKYRKNQAVLGKFGNKPNSREIRNSYDFEHYCRDWMEYLGGRNAVVSSATQDGGVDVVSDNHIAQVKLYNGPIPVSQIRDLLGTSVDFGKKPVFFASMAYSKGSIEFADRNHIPLIIVDSFNGVIRGGNGLGESVISNGLQH